MRRSSDEDECRSDRVDYFFDYRNFCVVFFAGIFANAERAVLKAAVRQQKAALRKKPQRGLLLKLHDKNPRRRTPGRLNAAVLVSPMNSRRFSRCFKRANNGCHELR